MESVNVKVKDDARYKMKMTNIRNRLKLICAINSAMKLDDLSPMKH